VARTRSPVIQKRNDEIYAQWLRGATLTALGEQYGISRQVVARLVAERHPEEDEDLERATYRGYLWRLFDEVKDLYDAPGFKMSPTGRPAEDPNGDPAEDTNVKLQAAELELKVLESLRKLDARDRPQRSHVTVDVARQEAASYLAEVKAKVEADNREMERLRRAAVIPGEVVRELPAGGA
jgi:hypothetical protein